MALWKKRVRNTDWKSIIVNTAAAIIYLAIVVITILLPLEIAPPQGANNASVGLNNNYLGASCPIYTAIISQTGEPLSEGPLHLPYQRPLESCRTFTSSVMEMLIANMTSRMVDKDLARLFENTYPNTLGTVLSCMHSFRHRCFLVQSGRIQPIDICYYRRHWGRMVERFIASIRSVSPIAPVRCKFDDIIPRPYQSSSAVHCRHALLQCFPASAGKQPHTPKYCLKCACTAVAR